MQEAGGSGGVEWPWHCGYCSAVRHQQYDISGAHVSTCMCVCVSATATATAAGVEHASGALTRVATTPTGIDPRPFTLLLRGGPGGGPDPGVAAHLTALRHRFAGRKVRSGAGAVHMTVCPCVCVCVCVCFCVAVCMTVPCLELAAAVERAAVGV